MFFPASLLPVLLGSAWGARESTHLDFAVLTLAVLIVVLLHAGGNVINDVADEYNGADRHNDRFIYPHTGGSRFIQTGIMSTRAMRNWGMGLLLAATLAGLILIALRGVPVLWFGLSGIALGVMYSVAPFKLGSRGMGELVVALAFGVLPIIGSAWLQGARFSSLLLLFTVPVSLWVTAILLINEVPDVRADAAAGKRTLAVRLGAANTAMVYRCLHLLAFFSIVALVAAQSLPPNALVVPAILLVLAWQAAMDISRHSSDRKILRAGIEKTLQIHTVGAIWLMICVVF
jgi:1,4-dihydroxy-2-naphthoate octaprenyltransferase